MSPLDAPVSAASSATTRALLSGSNALPAGAPPDADRPGFHVAPKAGWLNDPNGLIYYKGRYHLFYQHVERGCEWQWGLVWGHAVSDDLAHWRHLAPALRPTPGGPDADGCWSGCCAVSREGVPTLLYTGVRLRSNRGAGPPPPPDHDLGLLWIETQCAAVPEDPDDDLLVSWCKLPDPAVALPPPGLSLAGWRDPFVFIDARSAEAAPSAPAGAAAERRQGGYRMLLGGGVQGAGGALLGYSSQGDGPSNGDCCASGGSSLAEGWRYEGPVCSAADLAGSAHSAGYELGEVWECPLLVQLPQGSCNGAKSDAGSTCGREGCASSSRHALWLLAVSPYPARPPYAPSNPVLYWIGRLDEGGTRFDLANASGPHRLDHGDLMYAPNCCTDGWGRRLLWAWLQERRAPGAAASYAGCLTAPRQLCISKDCLRLVQRPAPELALLRRGSAVGCDNNLDWTRSGTGSDGSSNCGSAVCSCPRMAGWYAEGVEVAAGQPLWVLGVAGQQLDLELTFTRGSAEAAGLLILSHKAASQGNALLTYSWPTNSLTVRFGVPAPEPGSVPPHLQPPLAASSPRKQPRSSTAAAAAEAIATAAASGSAAAAVAAPAQAGVSVQLAELAEPLPKAADAMAAVVADVAAVAAEPEVHQRLVGGALAVPAAEGEAGKVTLRVLIDGSALEVFTGSGEVLSTRVYRGAPPASALSAGASSAAPAPAAAVEGPAAAAAEPAAAAQAEASQSGIAVVALGGAAVLECGAAWEMRSCWVQDGREGAPAF